MEAGEPRKGTRDTNLRERTAREINKLGHAVAAAGPVSPVLTYFDLLQLSRTSGPSSRWGRSI